MRTISIINLKGGVAKTISSANMGYILATLYNFKVLLMDNDKQGNLSKMFGRHNYNHAGTHDIMAERNVDVNDVIQHTDYENLDIITTNMNLLSANQKALIDVSWTQQTRFKNILKVVQASYDFCIIDNAPDINISTINGLVVANDVLIPIKIDDFAFDGLKEIKTQVEYIKEEWNPNLTLTSCFVTQYVNNEVNNQGEEYLHNIQTEYPVFKTHIRRTPKVDESTFANLPLQEYSRRSGAAKDYIALTDEYLEIIGYKDTKESR